MSNLVELFLSPLFVIVVFNMCVVHYHKNPSATIGTLFITLFKTLFLSLYTFYGRFTNTFWFTEAYSETRSIVTAILRAFRTYLQRLASWQDQGLPVHPQQSNYYQGGCTFAEVLQPCEHCYERDIQIAKIRLHCEQTENEWIETYADQDAWHRSNIAEEEQYWKNIRSASNDVHQEEKMKLGKKHKEDYEAQSAMYEKRHEEDQAEIKRHKETIEYLRQALNGNGPISVLQKGLVDINHYMKGQLAASQKQTSRLEYHYRDLKRQCDRESKACRTKDEEIATLKMNFNSLAEDHRATQFLVSEQKRRIGRLNTRVKQVSSELEDYQLYVVGEVVA